MLESVAARGERGTFQSHGALRCFSKYEGVAAAVLIVRDARKLARICGACCAFALLRMRTTMARAAFTIIPISRSPSRSRGAFFAPGFCFLASRTRKKG